MVRVPDPKSDCSYRCEAEVCILNFKATWSEIYHLPIVGPKQRVLPRCANAHNCFGPTLGRWWNSDYVILKLNIRSSASPCSVAVWLAFWNSDHVVLKLSIHTSAWPRRQWSHRGLRLTQHAYFSLSTHTKQLLLVTFCDMLAGIEVIFWADVTGTGTTDGRYRNGQTDGQTNVEVEIVI